MSTLDPKDVHVWTLSVTENDQKKLINFPIYLVLLN